MSILIFKLQCEKCHHDWHPSSWTIYYYELPNFDLVPFSPNDGWCGNCAGITKVVPEHRNRIIATEFHEVSRARFFESWRSDRRERQARAAQLEQLLQFADRGPVCATCGSSQVTSYDPGVGFVHPGCGGIIGWRETGMRIAFAAPPSKAVYSPTGERLKVAGSIT